MNNRAFSILGAAMLLVLFGAAQQLDPHDFESDAVKERREWMTAISVCHRAYGPSTQPEYDDRGHLVCVSRRGEVLPYRVAAK